MLFEILGGEEEIDLKRDVCRRKGSFGFLVIRGVV